MLAGITIRTWGEAQADFDLRDILRLLGDDIADLQWQCRFIECLGEEAKREEAEELMAIGDRNGWVSNEELLRLTAGIYQTIDGYFDGYRPGRTRPCLRLQAVDGSWWDVVGCDGDMIERLQVHFAHVVPIAEADLSGWGAFDCTNVTGPEPRALRT